MKKFNTIILAAGKGTRVREYSGEKSKIMIQVRGVIGVDHFIEKFKSITDTFIICTGYRGYGLEVYIKNKHPDIKFRFVRQNEDELASGPGKSAILGLKACNPKLPTLIMFCDILIEDEFRVDLDGLGVCLPAKGDYVYGTYKTIVDIKNGYITKIVKNKDLARIQDGWTGFSIIQDTAALQNIADQLLETKDIMDIDYSMELITMYLNIKKMRPIYLSKIYEFGTKETIERLKK